MSDDRVVINLADFRVSKAGPRHFGSPPPCKHAALVYAPAERLITCSDCQREVSGFDAFMVLMSQFERVRMDAEHRLRTAQDAEKATVGRRAAKVFDKAWSGHQMAVCCPHCDGGLLPEDILGRASQRSADLERARRARAAAKEPSK